MPSHLLRLPALRDVPGHFAQLAASPYLIDYLCTVLRSCPPGGKTCEVCGGTSMGAAWLSLRGVDALSLDENPLLVERSRHAGNLLHGSAAYRHVPSTFDLNGLAKQRFDVIHHQGLLEHLDTAKIREVLTQQLAAAEHVVFSVPSVFYPFEPEQGNERLLTLDMWEWILSPFEIKELCYYGDPRLGGQEHVMAVVKAMLGGFCRFFQHANVYEAFVNSET